VKLKKPVLKLVKKIYASNFRLGYIGMVRDEVIEFDPIFNGQITGVDLGVITDLKGWDCAGFSTYHWLSIQEYDILEPTNLACMLYGEKNES
jgi:hypothetical protein